MILVVHTYEPGDLPENLFGAAEGCGRNSMLSFAVDSLLFPLLCFLHFFARAAQRELCTNFL